MSESEVSAAQPPRPVIVGYDGREPGNDALALGACLARALGAPLLVASVYPSEAVASAVPSPELRARAEQLAEEGVERIAASTQAELRTVAGRSAAHGLHDLSEAEDAAAVVVGSTHRGALGRVLAGNVAGQLLSGSSCPVAVAPRGFAGRDPGPIRKVGVGFDDGPESWTALQSAAALAAGSGAGVSIIHALEPMSGPPGSPGDFERTLIERRERCEIVTERAVASVSGEVHATSLLAVGDPVRVLESEAHGDLDLLVVGSRCFGPVRRVLLGSVSSELLRLAPCPVLVVPRRVEA